MLCNGVTLRHLLRFTTEQAAVDIRPFGGARRWRYPTLTHPYPPLPTLRACGLKRDPNWPLPGQLCLPLLEEESVL